MEWDGFWQIMAQSVYRWKQVQRAPLVAVVNEQTYLHCISLIGKMINYDKL